MPLAFPSAAKAVFYGSIVTAEAVTHRSWHFKALGVRSCRLLKVLNVRSCRWLEVLGMRLDQLFKVP